MIYVQLLCPISTHRKGQNLKNKDLWRYINSLELYNQSASLIYNIVIFKRIICLDLCVAKMMSPDLFLQFSR